MTNRMVTLTMPPHLVKFLDHLRWDLLLKAGCKRKLSRTAILRGLVTAFQDGRFDVGAVKDQKEFVRSLMAQIESRRGKKRKRGK